MAEQNDAVPEEASGVNVKVFSLRGIEVAGYDRRDDDDIDDEIDVQEASGHVNNGDAEAPPVYTKQRLCCPITRSLFIDPVVCKKDGVSYEKEALVGKKGDRGYYPNRSLTDYMNPRTNPTNELQSSNTDKKGIFFCPITCDLMRDPVIDPEGNTYERVAIVNWIQKHGVSPITRNPLEMNQLYANTTLFRVLYREIQIHAGKDVANSDEILAWKRDVSNFNYLTNVTKPTGNNHNSARALQIKQQQNHPSRMRVDYNGRWRNRNKNTVTMIGLLLLGLFVVVFLFLEFPLVAIWCLGALLVVGLLFVMLRLCRRPANEDEDED